MTASPSAVHYFGYDQLEELAAVLDSQRAVYAMLLHQPGPADDLGRAVHRQIIMVAQPDQARDLHYCRIEVGQVAHLGGQPLDGAEAAHALQQARVAWGIVADWLREQGFTLRQATPALPRNHSWLTGGAACLAWDQATRCWGRGTSGATGEEGYEGEGSGWSRGAGERDARSFF